MNTSSTAVSPKVTAATIAAPVAVAASVTLIWIVETTAKIDIPVAVEGAVPTLLAAGAAFIAGWFVRDPARGKDA